MSSTSIVGGVSGFANRFRRSHGIGYPHKIRLLSLRLSRDRSSSVTHVIGRLFPPLSSTLPSFLSALFSVSRFFFLSCSPPSGSLHIGGEPRFMRVASWDVCAKRLNAIPGRVTVPAYAEGGRLADHSKIFEPLGRQRFRDTRVRNEPTPCTDTLVSINHARSVLLRPQCHLIEERES